MTAHFTVGFSLYIWFFLLWSFRIWYKVMSGTCYNFSPLFFCIGSVKLLQHLRLRQKLMFYYYYLNFFPSNAAKKLLVKNVEHKVE